MEDTNNFEADIIPQNHEQGPGWFLILSYIVISIFCIYYLVAQWDWQSNYDKQQAQIQQQIESSR